MSALCKLLSGKNIVWSLILLLGFLVYSDSKSADPSLAAYLRQTLAPLQSALLEPTPGQTRQENVIVTPTTSSQAVEGASTGRQIAQVVKVVDGDTIEVELGGVREKIRIIGLDTPETVDPRKEVQCFGKEASNFAKENLAGKTVYLESDRTQANRDKYKRLLRFLFLNEGSLDFGKLMILEGFGHEYTYDIPYKYQKEYRQAQVEAQTAKKGLWADSACK